MTRACRGNAGLLLAVVAAFALGLTAPALADTLRVGKAGRTAFSFVPAEVGSQTGIFKNNGLDLDISSFGGDAKVQQAMAADSIDIGLGSGPGLAFIAKGSPVKGIAAMAGPPLIFALVVRNDGSGEFGRRSQGQARSAYRPSARSRAGLPEKCRASTAGAINGMTEVAIGDDGARVAAVKTKSLDAAIVNLAAALTYADHGDGRILLRFGEIAKHFHAHIIFATDKAIAAQPDAAAPFPERLVRDHRLHARAKDETVRIAMPVLDTDARLTSEIYDGLMPMFTDNGHFDPEALAVLSRSFVEMNALPEAPDMSKLTTEAFLPK